METTTPNLSEEKEAITGRSVPEIRLWNSHYGILEEVESHLEALSVPNLATAF